MVVVVDGAGEILMVVIDAACGALIGPIRVETDVRHIADNFVFGAFTAIGRNGRRYSRESGSGTDRSRLTCFRDDLRTLGSARRGSISVGDHDYFEVFTLTADGDRVQIDFTDAGRNIWRREIDSISWDDLASVVAQIDFVERHVGPLVGSCGACSEPSPSYDPNGVARHEFLVEYDYGDDVVEAVVVADSAGAIRDLFPELTVFTTWPADYTDAQYVSLPLVRLESPPAGILTLVLDDRRSPGP